MKTCVGALGMPALPKLVETLLDYDKAIGDLIIEFQRRGMGQMSLNT